MPPKKQSAPPALPPGTDPMFSVTCKDVVMGRGSGTQNHCGNVTYRKLVYLNKELYATSSKFDKLKISKAIVAAVREFGGNFVQADEERGGLYFDIGDKRAWDKTSQALREGQAEVRAKLAADEDPNGMDKVAEYKQVISERSFFAYACRMLESLYHPADGEESGIAACGTECPHARRRQTLNRLGADPMRIHSAMQSLAPLAPVPQLLPLQYNVQATTAANNPYNAGMITVAPAASSAHPYQGSVGGSMEPLSLNAPVVPGGGDNTGPYYQHLPFAAKMTPGGSVVTETTTAPTTYDSYSNSLDNTTQYSAITTSTASYTNSLDTSQYSAPPPASSQHSLLDTSQYTAPLASSRQNSSLDTSQYSTPAASRQSSSLDASQYSTPAASQQSSSLEPLPYQYESSGPPKHLPLTSNTSSGSVYSLRKFCSEDFELTSDEGKALMDQLNEEVDQIIQRKSHGLIQIDTTQAFEDLVFEEDSMAMAPPKGTSPNPNRGVSNDDDPNVMSLGTRQVVDTKGDSRLGLPKKDCHSSSSSSGRLSGNSSSVDRNSGLSRVSGLSGASRASSRMSGGLSYKDDMSLMNMSILSLNVEEDEDEKTSPISPTNDDVDEHEKDITPKSIFKNNNDPAVPKNIRKRETRVSFAGKSKSRSMSLMSMDDRSFSQLVDAISDPDADDEEESRNFSLSIGDLDQSESESQPNLERRGGELERSLSRKMGFPIRRTIAHRYGAGNPPAEVGPTGSGPNENMSNLKINEGTGSDLNLPALAAAPIQNPRSSMDFSTLASLIQNPGLTSNNSLRVMDMSLLGMSNMSMDFEPDPDLEES